MEFKIFRKILFNISQRVYCIDENLDKRIKNGDVKDNLIYCPHIMETRNSMFSTSGIILLIACVLSLLTDHFLPFNGWYLYIRTALALFVMASSFIIGYALSVIISNRNIINDEEYVPYRARFSSKTRNRISIIAFAIIFVVFYAINHTLLYTIMSGLCLSAIVAVLAFMRKTQHEMTLSELGIPDSRDLDSELKEEVLKEKSEEKKEERSYKGFSGLRRRLNGTYHDEVDDDETDILLEGDQEESSDLDSKSS